MVKEKFGWSSPNRLRRYVVNLWVEGRLDRVEGLGGDLPSLPQAVLVSLIFELPKFRSPSNTALGFDSDRGVEMLGRSMKYLETNGRA